MPLISHILYNHIIIYIERGLWKQFSPNCILELGLISKMDQALSTFTVFRVAILLILWVPLSVLSHSCCEEFCLSV